jgi:hypothetical protein
MVVQWSIVINMIYVVSGMGSMGTSLMMRMLVKGGIPGLYRPIWKEYKGEILNNPHGTFEYPHRKTVENCDGKCVKIFNPYEITQSFGDSEVKVIAMKRKPQHILESHKERAERQNRKLGKSIEAIYYQLERLENGIAKLDYPVLRVEFEDVFNNTDKVLDKIEEFVGDGFNK